MSKISEEDVQKVTARANEQGYFPTRSQALRICEMSSRLCEFLAPGEQVSETKRGEFYDASIEQVMEGDADARANPRAIRLG
jgi:hypothetical protein